MTDTMHKRHCRACSPIYADCMNWSARQSIIYLKKMDARVKPGHDDLLLANFLQINS